MFGGERRKKGFKESPCCSAIPISDLLHFHEVKGEQTRGVATFIYLTSSKVPGLGTVVTRAFPSGVLCVYFHFTHDLGRRGSLAETSEGYVVLCSSIKVLTTGSSHLG